MSGSQPWPDRQMSVPVEESSTDRIPRLHRIMKLGLLDSIKRGMIPRKCPANVHDSSQVSKLPSHATIHELYRHELAGITRSTSGGCTAGLTPALESKWVEPYYDPESSPPRLKPRTLFCCSQARGQERCRPPDTRPSGWPPGTRSSVPFVTTISHSVP